MFLNLDEKKKAGLGPLFLFYIWLDSLLPVCDLPCGKEDTFCPQRQKIKLDFVHLITWLMIVFVNSIKIENDWMLFLASKEAQLR